MGTSMTAVAAPTVTEYIQPATVMAAPTMTEFVQPATTVFAQPATTVMAAPTVTEFVQPATVQAVPTTVLPTTYGAAPLQAGSAATDLFNLVDRNHDGRV